MVSRRDFLKTGVCLTALSAAGSAALIPSAARGEVITTIAAVVSIASTIVSMFNRSNAMSREFQQLNARLDAMIELQQVTLSGLQAIQQQISELAAAFPTLLFNQTLQEKLSRARGILIALQQIGHDVADGADLSEEDAQEIATRLLPAVINDARELAASFAGDLESGAAPGEAGLQVCISSAASLYALSLIVPCAKAIEDDLLIRAVSFPSHNAAYRVINSANERASIALRTQLAPQQTRFQSGELDGLVEAVQNDGDMRNWSRTLVLPVSRLRTETSHRFVNYQAYGPCNMMRAFNSDEEAVRRSRQRIGDFGIIFRPWNNYRFRAQVLFRHASAIIEGQDLGLRILSWEISSTQRQDIGAFDPSSEWGPRRNATGSAPRFPFHNEFNSQYICPGSPWYSQRLLDEYHLPRLRRKLRIYRRNMLEQTARRVNNFALSRTIAWCRNLEEAINANRPILAG